MASSRKRAAVADEIISWLDMNYELSEGVCLPRSLLYQHYSDACLCRRTPAIGAAAFGKMVRRKFSSISTRRLGTRGQSKYHYYGLAVKKSSKYYEPHLESSCDTTTLPGFSVFKSSASEHSEDKKTSMNPKQIAATRRDKQQKEQNVIGDEKEDRAASDDARLGRAMDILLNFPASVHLFVPPGIPCHTLDSFLNMYKAHFRNVLRAAAATAFDDIQMHLIHFWNEIPDHLSLILANEFVANVIETCDILFYEALEEILLPCNLDKIPDGVSRGMAVVLEKLASWTSAAIHSQPGCICSAKTRALDEFLKSLRRHLSLIPLIKSCSLILSQPLTLRKMVLDLKKIDFSPIHEDVNLLIEPECLNEVRSLISFFAPESESEEESVLTMNNLSLQVKQSVHRFILRNEQSYVNNSSCLIGRGCLLLMAIGRALTSLSRELTLINSSSFGYWHLVFLLINDLALVSVEVLIRKENYTSKRSSLSRRYFQPELLTSCSQEKEFILQLL